MEPIVLKLRRSVGLVQQFQRGDSQPVDASQQQQQQPFDYELHVDYEPDCCGVVLVFVGDGQDCASVVKRDTATATPKWAPGASREGGSPIEILKHVLDQFDQLLDKDGPDEPPALLGAMLDATKGYIPRRITCTGHHYGGALATVAALWAAVTVPTADIRCVTFGAPPVGNAAFATASQALVGISYRVVHESDPVPHCLGAANTSSEGGFVHVKHPIWLRGGAFALHEPTPPDNGETPSNPADHSEDAYAAAIEEAAAERQGRKREATLTVTGVLQRVQKIGTGIAQAWRGAITETLAFPREAWLATAALGGQLDDAALPGAGVAALAKRLRRGVDDYETSADAAHSTLEAIILEGRCAQAGLFCSAAYRSRFWSKLGLRTFGERTGLQGAEMVRDKHTDAEAYVAWLDGGTAVFAFRGSEGLKDWACNASLWWRDVPFMEECFRDGEVQAHKGFFEQFNALTSGTCDALHVDKVLARLSGGKTPTRVLVCGHSLGGALAAFAAPWAACRYPDADVRFITFGGPAVGDAAYVRNMQYLLGATHRVVHAWDPVPNLMFSWYQHVPGELVLRRAAPAKLGSRNRVMGHLGALCGWRDHAPWEYNERIYEATRRRVNKHELHIVPADEGGKEGEQNEGGRGVKVTSGQDHVDANWAVGLEKEVVGQECTPWGADGVTVEVRRRVSGVHGKKVE